MTFILGSQDLISATYATSVDRWQRELEWRYGR